jgi:hypothetical protein
MQEGLVPGALEKAIGILSVSSGHAPQLVEQSGPRPGLLGTLAVRSGIRVLFSSENHHNTLMTWSGKGLRQNSLCGGLD